MAHVYTVTPRRSAFSGMSTTLLLVLINVILFILFTIILSINSSFIDFIAIKSSNILHGKYLWTFLTSMFMHADIFHLLMNMVSLFFIGSLVERLLGRRRYLPFYLIAGFLGSLLFILAELISPSGLHAVGASGAIFGLIGLLMVLTPNLPVYLMFIPIPVKMKYAAPGLLIVLWLVSITGGISIGNSAHLGGFLFGLAYGFYLRNKYKNKVKTIQRVFS